jgi:rRNA maturation RNase YbeY
MIRFFCEDVKFNLKDKLKVKQWIKNTIIQQEQSVGDINIIFCSDKYLLKINKEHLKHDYYTDIITFNYNTEKINGDLFISIDRVNENAEKEKVSRETELRRVIIHGVLHLLGFNDKTKKEKLRIREKENESLKLYNIF